MEISDDLLCLFTAQVSAEDDSYHIEIPDREIENGSIDTAETYRVAILRGEPDTISDSSADQPAEPAPEQEEDQQPPVDVGETREVEIDSIGDQGDGIARIDRGYVVIVPDTEVGDRATVRIETAKENVAFGEVVERHHRPQHN
ncbi:TRAM domain-containing protein [Halonotius sp. GCM10025705]|uniref:TRAM domain-containing protein n=1 Tax=Halonotius sp. GCM10025705 TaxID=3252678 RepID=UPI003616CFEB